MRAALFAGLACLLCASVAFARSSDPEPKPLAADQAAVVGGWSGPFMVGGPVQGLRLDKIADQGGCLKYGEGALLVTAKMDDPTPVAQPQQAQTVKPGRYVLGGTLWQEVWLDPYYMTGVSRADGDAWVVDIPAGVVTDLGVWPITSPYAHRFVPGPPQTDKASPGAEAAAKGVGPLAPAHWTRMPLAEAEDVCPAPTAK